MRAAAMPCACPTSGDGEGGEAMNARTKVSLALVSLLLVLLGLIGGSPARAEPTRPVYTIDWWTVDGGGGNGQCSNGMCISWTLGQPDAGEMIFKQIALQGGFWTGITPEYISFLPSIAK